MICKNCGSNVPEDNNFCTKCGTKVEPDVQKKESKQESIQVSKNKQKKKMMVIYIKQPGVHLEACQT